MPQKDDMELFAQVADAGSYSAAAQLTDLSRSLISKRIKALETRLGVRLLNRTTRKISLTESGAIYLDYCRSVGKLRTEAEERMGELRRIPQGRLRISLPVTYGQLFIAPLIPGFLDDFPGIRLDMQMEDRFVDLIDSGIDVAIRIGELEDSGLIARRMGSTRLMAVASPAYLARHGIPNTPGELDRHNCLTYRHERQRSTVWRFTIRGAQAAIPVTGNLRADNGLLLRAAVLNGAGIAMLPEFMLRESLASGELVTVLEAHCLQDLGIYAVHTHRRPPLKIKAWLDYLSSRLNPQNQSQDPPRAVPGS